ncbi:MAG: autotransporter-associated beta strand repeat-containing protein [Tepidisphaeraceae bacterium]
MRGSRRRYLMVAASAAGAISISTTKSFGQLAAFPGALGFGANATGGRVGTVEVVSNLNSSGAGSFAAAVTVPNSIVVFTVGGYISLGGEIAIARNVTIEGQTAPGQGIGLMDGEISFSNSSNDIVRDIRVRQGTGSGVNTSKSGVQMDGGSNIILDHLSVQFGQWDTMDLTNSSNVTVQNSILSDAIHQQFGIHGQSDSNMTYAYNVFANDHNRNPVQAGFTSGNSGGTRQEDVVNNYFITGPSTTSNSDAAFYQVDSGDQMYASGNMEDSNKNGALDGSAVSASGATAESVPWFASTSTMPTFTAAGAYAYDTTYAGQSLSRDSLDSLDIGQVESLGTTGGTASTGDHLYTSPSQSGLSNGGYGTITGGTPPTSSANDGIPDTWATTHGVATWAAAHGTTTANPAFAMVLDPLGYSQIEDYANSLADQFVSQTWSAASGNWTTAANWSSTLPGIFQHALIRGTGTADGSVTITTSGNLAESLSIGGNGLSAGEQVNVSSGGGLTVEDTIFVGDQNNSTLAISGGSVIASNVQLGDTVWDSGGTATNYIGTLNLTGGTLQTGQLVQGAGTPGSWTTGANWTWSGGTLEAQTTGLFVNAPATLGSGGAILNTNGATATLTGVLSGSGSFTKNGAGLAILSAANTYTGGSNINLGAVEAANNQSLGTQTVTINIGDGLQLANGVSIANTIVANGGASEVVDVPFANASATLAGNISLASQGSDQYRVGVSGTNATLMLTGASTVSSAISLITRGNIVFAQNGSLNVANNGVEIGRYSTTSSVNLTVQDNASISATSISLGGLNGSSDDLNTNVTLLGGGALNANTGSLNIDNSLTTNNTTTLTLSGTSNVYAGNIVETSTATGHVATVNLNGGTINATANDPSGGSFVPVLNAATFNVKTGGAIVNNGGFSITLAQPLLGTTGDGGFTSEGGGTTTLLGANTYNGSTKVLSGTLVIGVNGALPNTSVAITGGTLQLGAGTGLAQMTSLSITGDGVLDVNNNHAIITYGSSDPFSTIAGYIASGYNGGAWNGPGMISTAALTPTNGLVYGVGYADGADGVVSGLSSGQIEVKYTLLGDANLDGLVNAADFTILAANFNQPVTGWDQGDFNYDGLVNAADFTDLAANFNQGVSGADVSAGDVAALDAFAQANGLVADVPEPALACIVPLAALPFLTSRRRRAIQTICL